MNLVDVHAHLDFEPLASKLQSVLDNATNVGVKTIVSNGVNPESNRKVLELAKKHAIIQPALGFYPWHAAEVSEELFNKEIDFIASKKPIALGEIGLDKKWDEKEHYAATGTNEEIFKKQLFAFEKFISLAEKQNIPLIIHSRKAELDAIELLESSRAKRIVMHCFSGKKRLVKRIIDNGWSVSIPVIVTKLQQFQEMVMQASVGQLLTETDSPYLGLSPGLTNEPANVRFTIKKLAELKDFTPEDMANQIFLNYQRLFL